MKAVKPTKEQFEQLLHRGVSEIIVRDQLEKRIKKGERLRLYHGIDPTGAELHLGHAVVLRKLRQFQDLGHEVILLIGDFTAQIGDPSGRTAGRVPLTHEQVMANAKDYKRQAAKILDFKSGENPIKLMFNSKWLAKLSFKQVLELAMQFTVQQMIEREMFQVRIKEGKPIGLHEFLYPLMQGYDSVAMAVDLEVGGSDQLFNMLAGRHLMKVLKKKEKHVMTLQILEGLDGRKMSKTYNNYVAITAEASDMFGKIMSLQDDLIIRYFELCTDRPLSQIKQMKAEMKAGANPRDYKLRLAGQIVSIYHGAKKADQAQANFLQVFQKGELPSDIAEVKIKAGEYLVMDLLVKLKLVSSKSQAGQVIAQKGVKVNDKVVSDRFAKVRVDGKGVLIQKGKLNYLRVIGA